MKDMIVIVSPNHKSACNKQLEFNEIGSSDVCFQRETVHVARVPTHLKFIVLELLCLDSSSFEVSVVCFIKFKMVTI